MVEGDAEAAAYCRDVVASLALFLGMAPVGPRELDAVLEEPAVHCGVAWFSLEGVQGVLSCGDLAPEISTAACALCSFGPVCRFANGREFGGGAGLHERSCCREGAAPFPH